MKDTAMKRHAVQQHDFALPPLHRAAAAGDLDTMKLELQNGAVHRLDGAMGATPLHYAAQGGSVPAVEMLLRHGALLNAQVHSHGMTPLMVAVWHRQPEVVKALLSKPAIDVGVRNRFGTTAEQMVGVASVGQKDTTQDAKIRVLFKDWNKAQSVPSLIAVLEDADLTAQAKTDKIKMLLANGVDPNQIADASNSSNAGHSALLIAARDGLADVVGMLLKAGADMTLVGNYMLAHPAHKAGFMGHADVLRTLIAHPDFIKIINIQGPFNGYTALHDAAWNGHVDATRMLLGAGARTDLRGYDGMTPAELARHSGYPDIAALIGETPQAN